MNEDVSIIDYGVGNINSVVNMLARAGAKVTLAKTPQDVIAAKRLVLPGVGAFDECRRSLDAIPGLEGAIHEFCDSGRPMLGICVGMQLLGSSSEEGDLSGLNIIPGTIRRFSFEATKGRPLLKVPHMGWSSISIKRNNPLFDGGLVDVNRFYFVHSYYFDANDAEDVAAECEYGFEFAASVRKGNVFGAQFHPEKSHRFGLQMFKNFISIR